MKRIRLWMLFLGTMSLSPLFSQLTLDEMIPEGKYGKSLILISVDTSVVLPQDMSLLELRDTTFVKLDVMQGSGITERFKFMNIWSVTCLSNAHDPMNKNIKNVFEIYSTPAPMGSEVEICYRIEYVQKQYGKKKGVILRLIYKKQHDQTMAPGEPFFLF